MAKRKRKKNHWTTKNTHFQRKKKMPKKYEPLKFSWWKLVIVLLIVIWMIFKIMNSQDRSGYDHFVGMPDEWIKWVK